MKMYTIRPASKVTIQENTINGVITFPAYENDIPLFFEENELVDAESKMYHFLVNHRHYYVAQKDVSVKYE